MSKYNNSVIDVSAERKFFIGIGVVTLLILVGGVWFLSAQGAKEQAKLNKPLMGEEVPIQNATHIKPGESHPPYNSNPPTGGWMYEGVAGAGTHDQEVADELLVHSMEHGAVIVHYKADLPADQVEQIKVAYNSASGRTILVPRKNLNVPVALTSWGRLLALQTIDQAVIKAFIETNDNRGTEKAAI